MKHLLTSLLFAAMLSLPLHAAPPSASISKQQAVEIAQQHQPGRVLSVQRVAGNGGAVYRVKTLGEDGSVRIVLIDAASGEVLSR